MKDAKGHGSNPRGGSGMPAGTLSHETLRLIVSNPQACRRGVTQRGLSVPSSADAEGVLRSRYGYSDAEISQLKGASGIAAQHGIDTTHLNAQGHEWGSPAALADFKAKYGGPRDHAAEQRGFNSGRREINRLKRQGK